MVKQVDNIAGVKTDQCDVVLLHPAYSYPDKSPPLGLAYLQAYLKNKGVSCRIIDVDGRGLTRHDTIDIIASIRPRVLGISFMTNQAKEAYSLIDVIKQILPELVVAAGGCHVSALPLEAIDNGFDAVVVGEGEESFFDLVSGYLSRTELSHNVPGIVVSRVDDLAQRRPLIGNLDELPFADWSDLAECTYTSRILGSDITAPVFYVITSRGCPGNCIFCASRCVFGNKYRKRSADDIFEELVELHESYNARLIKIVDDTFTIDKERVKKLCRLIDTSGLKIEWVCNARVDTVDQDLMEAMASSGCKNICFGVESGDPKILANIKKKITIEQIRKAHYQARKAGLIVSSYFMVGNLGEDFDSIEKTIILAAEISDYPSVSIATPYPGTELFEITQEREWLRTTDWGEYVTAPHVNSQYRPVATNGKLDEKDLMMAYYYVNKKFIKQKLRSRYGQRYYLNGDFYNRELKNRIKAGGFLSVAKVGARVLSTRMRLGK